MLSSLHLSQFSCRTRLLSSLESMALLVRGGAEHVTPRGITFQTAPTIELKRGDDPRTRAFFLPPYYNVFLFEVEGSTEKLESFTLLPIMLTRTLTSRTNDNVECE